MIGFFHANFDPQRDAGDFSIHSLVGSTRDENRHFDIAQGRIEMPSKSGSHRSSRRRYSRTAGKTVGSAMRRRKRGTLKSGKGGRGGTVKSRKQAIAIGLSEARKKGAKVPPKKK
jgi:hypothetical protein